MSKRSSQAQQELDQQRRAQRGEDLAHIAGTHLLGAGVIHGLAGVEAVAVQIHLAGVAVHDGDIRGLGCAQQTGLRVSAVDEFLSGCVRKREQQRHDDR